MIIYSRKKDTSYTVIGSFCDDATRVRVLIDDGSTELHGVFTAYSAVHQVEEMIDKGTRVQKFTIVTIDAPPAKS